MANINLVSILQAIIEFALKIKNEVETFRHNKEDCRRIGELVGIVRGVAEGLKRTTPSIMDDGALSDALKGLKQVLERAWKLVAGVERKNGFMRAVEAESIAVKLRRVCVDISLNLSAVVLANGAYNTSMLGNINGNVEALRAAVAYNSSMLAKIMEIVVHLEDAHLQLLEEMAELVQVSYSNSTVDANCANKTRRETYNGWVSGIKMGIDTDVKNKNDLENRMKSAGSDKPLVLHFHDKNSYTSNSVKKLIEKDNDLMTKANYAGIATDIKDKNDLENRMKSAGSDKLLVLYFHNKNHNPSNSMMTSIENNKALLTKANFYVLDVDKKDFETKASDIQVRAYPTLVLHENGKEKKIHVGRDFKKLKRNIDALYDELHQKKKMINN